MAQGPPSLPPGFVPPVPPNIDQLAGPPFLGIYLNGCLYGMLVLQYYSYCSNFGNDLRWLRYIVHFQFILETAQTVMTLADAFHWFVFGYGNVLKLGEFFLSGIDAPLMGAIIALVSQGVYCWRIYHISKWKIPTFIIALISCGQATGGIGLGIFSQLSGTFAGGDRRIFHPFLLLWTVCSAAADVLIAASMTYLLLTANRLVRSRTTVVTRLVRLVIETNAATAAVAIVVLLATIIPSIAPPAASYFLCPGYVLGKLYSNSFIAMLNNRRQSGAGPGGSGDYQSSLNASGDRQPQSWNNQSNRAANFTPSGVKGDAFYRETAVDLELAHRVRMK